MGWLAVGANLACGHRLDGGPKVVPTLPATVDLMVVGGWYQSCGRGQLAWVGNADAAGGYLRK